VRPVLTHPWNLAPHDAFALQRALASRVRATGRAPRAPFLVAGCDATGSGRWARRDE